jgi:hypothetical protein
MSKKQHVDEHQYVDHQDSEPHFDATPRYNSGAILDDDWEVPVLMANAKQSEPYPPPQPPPIVVVADDVVVSKQRTSDVFDHQHKQADDDDFKIAGSRCPCDAKCIRRIVILVIDLLLIVTFIALTVEWQDESIEPYQWGISLLALILLLALGYWLWPATEIEKRIGRCCKNSCACCDTC